jgi:transaldolase
MSPEQAILAAKAGATYVSPFAGRIDDYVRDRIGMKRGRDYQKSDYYDFNLMKKVESKAIDKVLSSKNTSSPREVYLDAEVRDAVSRLNDNGIHSGVDLVKSIVAIFRNYHFKSQVIASSIRNARQVREMAEIGVDIVTVPFHVLRDMLIHYKTIEGINDFIKDVVEPYRKIFTW